jgi:hypothetical protein
MLTMKKTSGTLVYMSPQQLDGERASPLDDVYSMGATIYELLASKPPFYTGGVDKQIHEKKPVSIAERRSELGIVSNNAIPANWEATVAACLSKNPADRPQSARELAERLTGAVLARVSAGASSSSPNKEAGLSAELHAKPPPPPPPVSEPRPFRAARWWPVAAAAMVAAIAVLNIGRLKALSTDLFASKPKQEWARAALEGQFKASFSTAPPVRLMVKQLVIQSEGSRLAKVDVSGNATTTEALYATAAPDDPVLQTKLARVQAAEQQVAILRDYGGVEILPFNPSEFVFVRETAPPGQNASFHLQFEAEKVDSGWQAKRTTAAELTPIDNFEGKPIASFGSGAAILGTDRAKSGQMELSHRIDQYLARVDDAQKSAAKTFALAGRDSKGNLLFPPDHAALGERFPETRMRALTADELQLLSDDKLQYAINEVYARHGAAFDKKISSVFKKFPWYQPQPEVSLQEVEAALSSIETQNVKMLSLVRGTKQEQTAQQPVGRQRLQERQQQPTAIQKAKDAADIFSKVRPFLPGHP